MNNNTIGIKLKFQDLPAVPANQKLTAAEFNQLPAFQKSPVQQIAGSLDDTDIIIDGTKNYGTTIVVAGAARTITANASGHSQGNNLKQRYTFNINCTITLSGFDTLGNNTGTITPLLAGTYDFKYLANRNGINLEIPQNTQAQDISDKLDKVNPADQTIVSKVEFLGLAIASTAAGVIKTFEATPEFDFAIGNDHKMTLTGNVTAFTTTGEDGSMDGSIWLVNDGTLGRTVAAPTGWTLIPGGDTHDDAANAINLYQFKTDPENTIKKFIIKNM